MEFTYSTDTKRYRDKATGRFIGRVEVRQQLDQVIEQSAQFMKQRTDDLRNGTVSLAEWQTEMAREIKLIHGSMFVVADGGFASMDDNAWERLEVKLKEQYDYLSKFAGEIYTGEQVPNGTMLYRSTLYAESARATYENERKFLHIEAGFLEEKNILGGSDHCNDCLDATSQDWTDIGTLSDIGDRQCGAKCHCTIIFRKGPDDVLGSEEESF